MNEPKRDSAHADEGRLETPVRPCAWMAQHGREPVQATVSQRQAEAWAQAGGDVVELYDGPTLWNAIATADARRRELQAQIEQLQARLAQAGLEQQRAVREERERCKDIVRRHMPAGWSAAYDAMADEGPNDEVEPPRAAKEQR
jgi:hypothetical protein